MITVHNNDSIADTVLKNIDTDVLCIADDGIEIGFNKDVANNVLRSNSKMVIALSSFEKSPNGRVWKDVTSFQFKRTCVIFKPTSFIAVIFMKHRDNLKSIHDIVEMMKMYKFVLYNNPVLFKTYNTIRDTTFDYNKACIIPCPCSNVVANVVCTNCSHHVHIVEGNEMRIMNTVDALYDVIIDDESVSERERQIVTILDIINLYNNYRVVFSNNEDAVADVLKNRLVKTLELSKNFPLITDITELFLNTIDSSFNVRNLDTFENHFKTIQGLFNKETAKNIIDVINDLRF